MTDWSGRSILDILGIEKQLVCINLKIERKAWKWCSDYKSIDI